MENTKCRQCGSTRFNIVSMRLTLLKVPMWFENGKEAPQYDDTKAETCEGWDASEDREVECAKCGVYYEMDGFELGEPVYVESPNGARA